MIMIDDRPQTPALRYHLDAGPSYLLPNVKIMQGTLYRLM